ncbi:MAG TPA: hypothetical protein PL077_05880 [Treponemataceae bacterium]|nr:hypothetical protein [Treponemataceae bacterium]
MRVALIAFIDKPDRRVQNIMQKMANAAASKGNQVDAINGNEDLVNTRLTVYDYIAVCTRPQGLFGGKLPRRISDFLATSGTISGKKGCALVLKSGFSSAKTCKNLMKALEAEGLMLDYFDIVGDEDHGALVGKKIG